MDTPAQAAKRPEYKTLIKNYKVALAEIDAARELLDAQEEAAMIELRRWAPSIATEDLRSIIAQIPAGLTRHHLCMEIRSRGEHV